MAIVSQFPPNFLGHFYVCAWCVYVYVCIHHTHSYTVCKCVRVYVCMYAQCVCVRGICIHPNAGTHFCVCAWCVYVYVCIHLAHIQWTLH